MSKIAILNAVYLVFDADVKWRFFHSKTTYILLPISI